MAVGQQWLFAPARPLVDRLGRKFFRQVPTQPGVYSMRDACGAWEMEIRQALEHLFWGKTEEFSAWLLASMKTNLPAFERAALQADIEEIANFAASYRNGPAPGNTQLALL
jgi:hypothetical protein